MKIRLKIFLLVLLPSMLIFFIALRFLNIQNRELAIKSATTIADLYAAQAANTTKVIFEHDLSVAQTIRNSFLNYRDYTPKQRDYIYNQILANNLLNNNQFISVWASWELSETTEDWHDPYGRTKIETFKENGKINFYRDSTDLDGDDIKGLYYKLKSGEDDELLVNPYIYSYSDDDTSKSFLETTLAVPIIKDEVFAGVIGIDVSLERFKTIIEQQTPFENSYVFIVANDGKIVAHPNSAFQGKSLLNAYINLTDDVLNSIERGEAFQLFSKDQADEDIYLSFVPIKIGKTSTPWSVGIIVPKQIILESANKNFYTSIIVIIIVTLLSSLVMMLMYSNILVPLNKTTKILVELEKGNIQKLEKIKVNSKDELGTMANSVNNLVVALNSTVEFAKKIGKGDLRAEYKLLSNHDVLGTALLDMQKNLIEAKESEERRQTETRKLSWAQNGITQINEILRLENDTLEQLTFSVISFFVKYMGASQGGFYVINEEDINDKYIELLAAYAFDRKKQLTSKILIGEGLIGRSVKEKDVIYLTNLPEGYMFITSGLGDRTPNILLITPLIFEGHVFGVVEIASFVEFEKYQRNFIFDACERIASSISNIKKNVKTNELLKQSQQQSEKLKAREQDFEAKSTELKQTYDEISLKQKELNTFIDVITQRTSMVEYNLEGQILSIKDKKLEAMGVKIVDWIGKNISEIAKESKENTEWFTIFWTDLVSGKTRKRKYIYENNTNKLIYDETYIPIFDEKGKVYKIINFGIDITEVEMLKEKLKTKN